MEDKSYIEVLAAELSRKRKNTTTYRVKPSDCPIKNKYCITKTIDLDDKGKISKINEKFKCPFLDNIGTGNEDGFCVIHCSCVHNSISFLMED